MEAIVKAEDGKNSRETLPPNLSSSLWMAGMDISPVQAIN